MIDLERELGSFKGRYDGKHKGISLVGICEIFVRQDNVLMGLEISLFAWIFVLFISPYIRKVESRTTT